MTLKAGSLDLHFDFSPHCLQHPQPFSLRGLTYHWGQVPNMQDCLKRSKWYFPQALGKMILGVAMTIFCSPNYGMRRLLPLQMTLNPFDLSKEQSSVYVGHYYPSITVTRKQSCIGSKT